MEEDFSAPRQPNRLRLRLASGDGGKVVRLADLMVFLERLSGLLGTVDRAVNGRTSNYFNVSDLALGSAVVEIEERVHESRRAKRHTIRSTVTSFDELIQAAENVSRPQWASGEVLNKVRVLSDPLPHHSHAEVRTTHLRLHIDEDFRSRVDELLSPDTASEGQLTGRLDAINMHGRRHAYIYPLFGHQKVVCDFSSQADADVVNALQKRVRISGEVKRRSGDPFPYHVKAHHIEVLPPDDELPTLKSLRGLYKPTFESGSVEFQRNLRDGVSP